MENLEIQEGIREMVPDPIKSETKEKVKTIFLPPTQKATDYVINKVAAEHILKEIYFPNAEKIEYITSWASGTSAWQVKSEGRTFEVHVKIPKPIEVVKIK